MTQNPATPSTDDLCPHCGAMDQNQGARCAGCGRLIGADVPEWALSSRSRSGVFGRHGRIFVTQNKVLIAALAVIVFGALFWHNYHVIPNPIKLIAHQPSSSLSSSSEPGQWAMLGGDITRHRYVPEPPSLPSGRILWETEEGRVEGESVPAIVDGALYVGGRFEFLSLDSNTGEQLWSTTMSGLVNSSPSVAGDYVYFGSTDSNVWAFNKHTGEREWSFRTGNYISSSPMVHEGFLFIGSGDNKLYALDAETGDKIWDFTTDDDLYAPVSMHNGVLYFTSNDNSLYSVNYRTGEARMQFRTVGVQSFQPAIVSHGLAYIASNNGILTAHAGIREIPGRWQFERLWRTLWLRWGSPIPRPGAQHGTNWRLRPVDNGFITAAPAMTEEAFFVGDTQGFLRAIGPTDPDDVHWRFQAQGDIRGAPLVAGDVVYVATMDGMVYAVDRYAGTEIWSLSVGAPVRLPVSLAEGKLFLRTEDGRVIAIE